MIKNPTITKTTPVIVMALIITMIMSPLYVFGNEPQHQTTRVLIQTPITTFRTDTIVIDNNVFAPLSEVAEIFDRYITFDDIVNMWNNDVPMVCILSTADLFNIQYSIGNNGRLITLGPVPTPTPTPAPAPVTPHALRVSHGYRNYPYLRGIDNIHELYRVADNIDDLLEWNTFISDKFPTDRVSLRELTQPSRLFQSGHREITELANRITRNLDCDWEKTRAIHTWVFENIRWDYIDFPTDWANMDNSALTVLRNGFGICVGIARITVALLRAVNIPSMMVVGEVTFNYATLEYLRMGGNGHAWYLAFIDGMWMHGDSQFGDGYSNFFNMPLRPRPSFTFKLSPYNLRELHQVTGIDR